MSTDVAALISPTLLGRVNDVLDTRGIRHGRLVEGRAHLNLNLSDRAAVFVKVSRLGDLHTRAFTEIAAATWARAQGIACPSALIDAPVVVADENDSPRAVTVWSWTETVTPGALIDRCADVLTLIERIADVPVPPDARGFDLNFYRDRIRTRLGARADTISQAVLATAETNGERVADLLGTRKQCWSHLDLHLDNVGWTVCGAPVIFDWESAAIAPVEVDVAQILRSVFVNTPNYAPSERHRVATMLVRDIENRLDVDWRLVRSLVRFRAASQASHLLVHVHDAPVLKANLSLLESPLEWLPS